MPESSKRSSMKIKLNRTEIFIIIIVLLLLFIYTASITMLIPSYATIIVDFQIDKSLVYLPDSLAVLISAFVMVLWGYFTDRLDRNKVINGGVFLSACGFIFTTFCTNFVQLLIARIMTGAGMGFAIPVAISILSDIVPSESRSGLFGFLAIFSSISNGTGQGLAAFIGPLDLLGRGWQFPFLILSCFAVLASILLIFVKLPAMGAKEEGLADLHEFKKMEYGYKINQQELVKMVKKSTNKYLILNGLFSIVPGTIIIYSLISTFSSEEQGMLRILPDVLQTQVSTIMAGVASLGYILGSIILSRLGDVLYNKNRRNRTMLAFLTNVIALPLCILMIAQLKPISLDVMPIYPDPIPLEDLSHYMWATLGAIFQNYPNYILYVIFSFLGTFFSAAMVTNKNAVMVDVNLPEHRGTASSFFQLTEQIGKSLTLLVSGLLLRLLDSYVNMLYISLIFWIPSAYLWYLSTRSVVNDITDKELILRERQQVSFIDYFFEVNMAIDDGIQIVQDAKNILLKSPKKAEKMIDKAVNKFIWIIAKAHQQNIIDLERRAQELFNKIIIVQQELAIIMSKPTSSQLETLYRMIDDMWENSDFGNIEVLYESAYLKVCEARLRRYYNPSESARILQDAIEIYDRVIRYASDRVIEEGAKKISEDEEKLQERIMNLLILAQKSKSNTEILKSKLQTIIQTMVGESVPEAELKKIIELSSDYSLQLQEIVTESFDKNVSRKFSKAATEIDSLFAMYDEWQSNE